MIYGNEVGGKYSVIINEYKKELQRNITKTGQEKMQEMLDDFRIQLQNCKRPEFEEWYELFKPDGMRPKKTK